MKKTTLTIISLFVILIVAIVAVNVNNDSSSNAIQKLKEQHAQHLENSPFKETRMLSKKERKAMGLPPNAYNEQIWELTMDPSTGRPMPERLFVLQEDIRTQREQLARGVGGDTDNPWVNRGPDNQGGRTRGIMFDPNDVGNPNPNDDYTRVFSGGVSGGLWVNEDITDANSSWTMVPGIGANISVTVIVSDPNNSNVFYIGSGESYTVGQAVGRGVWKSEDGGVTWDIVFGGGVTSVTGGGQSVNGVFYVNDIIVRDNGGVSEVYAAIGSATYQDASSPSNFNGLDTMGLYKSTDGGDNWSRFEIRHADNTFKNPNDLELDINNNIWMTTTSNIFGNAGGDIHKSTDGITFTLEQTITGAARTELEASSTDANRFWVVVDRGQADLFTTTDGFATLDPMNEPSDVDQDISSTDYTRNQAFYNLPIEADENNRLYVGGIDLFRSLNNGATWNQLSKWSNNNDLFNLNVPLVHADQHAIVFRPGTNGQEAVFGNDGGVYYTANINSAIGNGNAIQARNRDYITTQFYSGDINDNDIANGDDMAGGTQDNGTQVVINSAPGSDAFFDPFGGDGGFTEIDESGTYMIQSYPGNTHIYRAYPSFGGGALVSSGSGGSFINQAVLDENLDILFSNASTGQARIERVTEFLPGGADAVSTIITDPLLNSSPSAMQVSPYNTSASTLFVGLRNGRLLRANFANFNPIWSNISGPSFVGSISDIEFGQSEQEIFVTMFNYGVVSVWFTSDGGNTWTNIEGNLPDVPVRCVLQNPLIPEELIIGTDLGVWATPDYTATNPVWIPAFNGMSDVTVVDLDLRPADNTILAATHGRGLFTSQFTATPLSVLESEFNVNMISLFPTVSEGEFTLKSQKDLGQANIEVYDINGRKVHNENINLSPSNSTLNLSLNSGLYFVNINVEDYSETKRIIIK